MDNQIIILGITSMGGLGFVLASLLVIANKRLSVEEDPRIDMIEELLPGANCGGCGLPGCRALAENIVGDKVEPNACPVCSDEFIVKIGKIVGKEVTSSKKRVAKVLCQGGLKETEKRAIYYGVVDCRSAASIAGGEKACSYACVGFGDCVRACKFDAIWLNRNGLPVVDEDKCTGCNKCAEVCPRNIIELHPRDIMVHVYCRNRDPGRIARKVCKSACIGCTLCAKACPDHIRMENNLAVIDYSKGFIGDKSCTEKCPTNAIAYDLNPILSETPLHHIA